MEGQKWFHQTLSHRFRYPLNEYSARVIRVAATPMHLTEDPEMKQLVVLQESDAGA